MVGILIMAVIYNVLRRRGRSRPKAAAFSIGIYYGVPTVLSLFLVSIISIGEYLPFVAPGLDRLAAISMRRGDLEPPTVPLTLPNEASDADMTLDANSNNRSDAPHLDSTYGTRPPEPHSLEYYVEQGREIESSANRAGCDPAYPDERTCIPPGPPFNQGCSITSERRFTVLPPDTQGLDADKDGIGCEPVR